LCLQPPCVCVWVVVGNARVFFMYIGAFPRPQQQPQFMAKAGGRSEAALPFPQAGEEAERWRNETAWPFPQAGEAGWPFPQAGEEAVPRRNQTAWPFPQAGEAGWPSPQAGEAGWPSPQAVEREGDPPEGGGRARGGTIPPPTCHCPPQRCRRWMSEETNRWTGRESRSGSGKGGDGSLTSEPAKGERRKCRCLCL
jgi:hypothetical protein